MSSGVKKINKESVEGKKKIIEKEEESAKILKERKKDFFEESKKSDTLAKDIAEELGVDFVNSK